MFKNFFKSHQYKIILGAPIIFLVIINSTGTLGVGNVFFFSNTGSNFVVVGDQVGINLAMHTKSPVNAVGGIVTMTPNIVTLTSISRISSFVDLWSEEPTYTAMDNRLQFSGGMIGEKAKVPAEGNVLVMQVKAEKEGVARIAMQDGQLLASNGEGTNIMSGSNILTLYVRKAGSPSPDVNGDGTLTVLDVNTLYLKTFRAYDSRYDLNADGRVSWTDVRLLLNLF